MDGRLLLLMCLAGCALLEGKPADGDETGLSDTDADTDADSDTDTDADSDADTDTDTDTDTDVDTGLEGLCDESPSTAAPDGPDCFTGTLECGDVLVGTNEGGSTAFVGEDWESWYCTPNLDRDGYASPERVYSMFIPAGTTATFELATPCADLDLMVLYWAEEDTCPTSANYIRECESVDGTGDLGAASVWSDVGAQYLVIVDGLDGEVGNYRLSVTCED